ncbi:MAG: DUF4388 domain-containing protein [Cyanobacteria bacterium P01_H01_bin.121]
MQGHLNEIDLRSILQLVELGQRTGELFIEAYGPSGGRSGFPWHAKSKEGDSWFVFFLNGQIIHATHAATGLDRLRDHLRCYNLDVDASKIKFPSQLAMHAPEYGYLWTLLEHRLLTPTQGRNIILSLTYETLFDLLSLHSGAFIFEMAAPLAPQLTTLEIGPMLLKVAKQIQDWKRLQPLVQSPEQRPILTDDSVIERTDYPRELIDQVRLYRDYLNGQHSIRQIARYLNQSILAIGQTLYRCAELGFLNVPATVTNAQGGSSTIKTVVPLSRPPRVVFIDDNAPIRQFVEQSLSSHGYEVTSLGNSLKALGLLFQLHPDLILCDIEMPDLDGYELCAMLRQSSVFRQTPIIMITGKEGFIDRLKARLAGATDYLTKPFGEKELMLLLERYVGPGHREQPEPNELLKSAMLDELGYDL